jgi:hypothetical protein
MRTGTLEKGEPIMASKDAPGMRGDRSRDRSGELRKKRSDTHMSTVEKHYDRDFGVRSDMHLDTYLKKVGVKSLNDLITGK